MTLCPESVLITGANRGIGLEFVKQFLELPTPPQRVFAACRSPNSAEDLRQLASKNASVTIVELDVTDEKTFEEAKQIVADAVGDRGLTLLINNAGIANTLLEDKLDTVTSDSMMSIYRVNAVGTLVVSKAFLPLLERSAKRCQEFSVNTAAIVNISSGVGSISGNDLGGGYAYRSSKAAQNMVTKSLSVDLKASHVLVAALHPGWVQTDMGGPRAPESASVCVGRIMDVMATLHGEDKSGQFYHNNGHVIPW